MPPEPVRYIYALFTAFPCLRFQKHVVESAVTEVMVVMEECDVWTYVFVHQYDQCTYCAFVHLSSSQSPNSFRNLCFCFGLNHQWQRRECGRARHAAQTANESTEQREARLRRDRWAAEHAE